MRFERFVRRRQSTNKTTRRCTEPSAYVEGRVRACFYVPWKDAGGRYREHEVDRTLPELTWLLRRDPLCTEAEIVKSLKNLQKHGEIAKNCDNSYSLV